MNYIKIFENWATESVKNDIKSQKYYHGSSKSDLTKLKHIVGEFDNMGGVFISPSYEFASKFGKHIYEVKLLTDNIFDIRKKEDIIKLAKYIHSNIDLVKTSGIQLDDLIKIINGGNIKLSSLFSKYNRNTYKMYSDMFTERKLKGTIRSKDDFREPYDYWENANQYAIEMMMEYPDKITSSLYEISRKYSLYQDYHSIEKLDSVIKKSDFDGAYVFEKKIPNIQVYDVDNIEIVKQLE